MFEKKLLIGITDFCLFKAKEQKKGIAFDFIKGLLNLNKPNQNFIEVILFSNQKISETSDLFYFLEKQQIPISRFALLGEKKLEAYISTFPLDLFLSSNLLECKKVRKTGIATSLIPEKSSEFHFEKGKIKIAFDADGVLFSNESHSIFQEFGLEAFHSHEKENTALPLQEGSLKKFLQKISVIHREIEKQNGKSVFDISILTNRNAPAHLRAIKTLNSWNIQIDSIFFLGGIPKDEILKKINPHFYFDDEEQQIEKLKNQIPCGKVLI
ncbi:5'-nucleotidase [Aureivirga sp. CE67]|uniref:5'-nucleotidase n=1 Tax=Aureivirga sp. CE67 TaxID=1788983 RepID=UPI0018C8E032|nr:5'-nucleotidase [Aureivirga sp. CE67]